VSTSDDPTAMKLTIATRNGYRTKGLNRPSIADCGMAHLRCHGPRMIHLAERTIPTAAARRVRADAARWELRRILASRRKNSEPLRCFGKSALLRLCHKA
jgi:hypothetical protein